MITHCMSTGEATYLLENDFDHDQDDSLMEQLTSTGPSLALSEISPLASGYALDTTISFSTPVHVYLRLSSGPATQSAYSTQLGT
jgi:hypothetical protein